jgi:hypothetical protein
METFFPPSLEGHADAFEFLIVSEELIMILEQEVSFIFSLLF